MGVGVRAGAVLLGLVFVCVCMTTPVLAYRKGDVVSTQKRSQYQKMRTNWSDVLGKHCPRFATDRHVTLPALAAQELKEHEDFKVSFSFASDRFVTPWLTVVDSTGRSLNFIQFTFFYSGNELKDVKWFLDYNDDEEHQGKKPKEVFLYYNWKEVVERDSRTGMNTLFLSGLLLTMGLVAWVLFDGLGRRETTYDSSSFATFASHRPMAPEETTEERFGQHTTSSLSYSPLHSTSSTPTSQGSGIPLAAWSSEHSGHGVPPPPPVDAVAPQPQYATSPIGTSTYGGATPPESPHARPAAKKHD
eukprot:TRINITY_DN3163_c0_g1_i1.p1 TRINITY_DN3163_c0_g1~~TRINITY_DN3163_c0_g1_i1.p1  ORF type:complete len:303 (+),score=49.42 TRINITY_DN3163_c0_g1_i1:74-982(+)